MRFIEVAEVPEVWYKDNNEEVEALVDESDITDLRSPLVETGIVEDPYKIIGDDVPDIR